VALLLNEPPPSYRAPRLCLLANGQILTGAYEAEVASNNHFSADRFDAVIALGPDPWADACFWSSEPGVLIDIQLGLDGGASFTSLIQGFADKVSIDPVGGVVRVSGRDFTAALIGAQTQEAFSNRTSSEIATIFAQRHGLVPCVVPTSTPVGRFYQSDHESLTLDRFSGATTEWDLLVYLARQESYDAFVTGTDLCFQPAAQISTIDQVLYPADMMELRLERALTLARDIQVTVQSWNSLQQMAFTESVSSTISGSSSSGSSSSARSAQQYVIMRPNLTPDKALAVAQQRLSELSRHERVIEFSMPGELALTPRSTIQLDGTGTDFDQAYYIDSIERTFRPQTGFIERVRASNSSPRTNSVLNSTS
jgi:phage protein D